MSQAGRIIRGEELTSDVDRTAEVCVVGSGAGGSVAAAVLAEAGREVVVLEEGGHHTKDEFDMQEGHCYPMLYQEQGRRATEDLSIHILQGRAVGGSTVVNWTSSFRTPEAVLDHWKVRHGVSLDAQSLAPHFEAVEERLNIKPCTLEDDVNPNNRVLWDGCAQLGWHKDLLRRNVKGCFRSGYCGMGCPVDAKQSMLVTYIPDALRQPGTTLYANCRVERVEASGAQVVALHASVVDLAGRRTGRRVIVRPRLAILSAGALNTPALLLRSGLGNSGVGRRTFFHPTLATVALFDARIDPFYGPPQSVYSHEFSQREGMGFFMEAPPVHPMLAGMVMPGFGRPHREVLRKLGHLNALIALIQDGFTPHEEGATVMPRGDGLAVSYHFTEPFWEAARAAMKATARIQLAAGAKEVYTLHSRPLRITREADLKRIDEVALGPNRVGVFTAHQMGGCAMGGDPERSVVDANLRHHRITNLYIVDGSVLPSSLGVNPQETIYALARRAAMGIAERTEA